MVQLSLLVVFWEEVLAAAAQVVLEVVLDGMVHQAMVW
jgi:hypothetical protein